MNDSLLYRTDAVILALLLCALMIGAAALGGRFGNRSKQPAKASDSGLGAVEAGMFGLLGLLLAFTFAAAASRADSRGHAAIELANAIGTTALRAELYAPGARDAFRADLFGYTTALIDGYRLGSDGNRLREALSRVKSHERNLWSRAIALSADPANELASLKMIDALNATFDAASSREMAMELRVPDTIFIALFVLAIATALTSGYASGLKGRLSWTGHVGFALLTCLRRLC